MQSSQGIDYSTLTWVRPSIDETLGQARDALESFVQDPQDARALQTCVDGLHQIKGTLTMMQTASAARLAEEMEATARAMADGGARHADEAIESLMRAILQLPDYLEWLQSGKPDRPQVLQPLIDDLRVARGEAAGLPPVALDTKAVGTVAEPKPDQEVRTLAGRVRPLYQSGLVQLLRDTPDEAGTRRMLQALDTLIRTCRLPRAHLLWTLAGGQLEAATASGKPLALPDKRLLGQIDREMKRLADQGERALDDAPNTDLLDNLGALIQAGAATGKRAQAARAALQTLQAETSTAPTADAEQPALSGVNAQVLETVTAAIREDLSAIKDALDLYARDPQPDAGKLAPLSEPLRKIADTLNVIGLQSGRSVVAAMGEVIATSVKQDRKLPDSAQLEMATAVLFVESALNGLRDGRGETTGDADEVLESLRRIHEPSDAGTARRVVYAALPDAEFQQVADAVMREAHIDIGRSKDAIAAFIDSPFDEGLLSDTPELFARISGALGLTNQPHAAALTDGVRVYLEHELRGGHQLPERAKLENLADAISAIEYFLEAKQLKRRDAEQVLDVAEQSLKLLGYPFPEAARDADVVGNTEDILADDAFLADLPDVDDLVPEPVPDLTEPAFEGSAHVPTGPDVADAERFVAAGPDSADAEASAPDAHPQARSAVTDLITRLPELAGTTEDDFLDIFLEEATEERDRIAGLLRGWRDDADNLDRVVELRRAYHTLKGSGRMVGATRLGEFAWLVEDLLNRVMDGGVTMDDRLFDTVEVASRHALPELIARLADPESPLTADVDLIAARLLAIRNHSDAWPDRDDDIGAVEHPAAADASGLADNQADAEPDIEPVGELLLDELAAPDDEIREPEVEEIDYGGLGEWLEPLATENGNAELPRESAVEDIEEPVAEDYAEHGAESDASDDAPPSEFNFAVEFGAEPEPLAEPPSETPIHLDTPVPDWAAEPEFESEFAAEDDEQRLDPVLYEIFSKELLGHLDTLDAFVADAREQGFPGKPSAELRRALHTILGSTRTTGITELADLAGPLDSYIKDAGVNEESLTETDLELLSGSTRLFRESIGQLNDPNFTFPDIGPLVDGISRAFTQRTRLRAEGPTEPDHETILGISEEDLADSEPVPVSALEAAPDLAPTDLPEALLSEAIEADVATSDHIGAPDADIADAHTDDVAPLADLDQAAFDMDETPVAPVDERSVEEGLSDVDLSDADMGEDDADASHGEITAATPPDPDEPDLPSAMVDLTEDLPPEWVSGAADWGGAEAYPVASPEAGSAAEPAVEPASATAENEGDGQDFQVDTDADLLDIFLEESAEILDAAEADLTQLQRKPDDRAIIASLQRGLHTLKGGARMAGLTPIGDLSHALETLFEAMGSGKVKADDHAIRLLNQCFDRLLNMTFETRTRAAISHGKDLIEAVDALTRGDIVELPVPAEAEPAEPVVAADDFPTLPEPLDMAELAPIDEIEAEPTPAPIIDDPVDSATGQGEPALTQDAAESGQAPSRTETGRVEQIRVRAEVLGNLVNLAGEVSIFRSRLEQQLGSFQFNITELDQTVARVRDQLRKLEIETEAQILSRYHKETSAGDSDFDPLELDRFSQLQQLSRALSEGINDLLNIQGALDGLASETETLLRQQSRVNTELQEGLMGLRMVPFTSVEPRLRRIVRQTAQELGKKVELSIVGGGSEIDRTILERMTAPLEHMLRNAISHGIEMPAQRRAGGKPETGTITVRLGREGADVVIEVRDDGAGVNLEKLRAKAIERGLLGEHDTLPDHDLMQLLLESGFSTAERVSQIAGRGVGMDVVRSEVRQLSGTLDINSLPGRGAWFTIRLPFTLSVNKALLITVGDDPYAIPLAALDGVIRLNHEVLQRSYGSDTPLYEYAGNSYALMHLGNLLGAALPTQPDEHDRVPVLLVRAGDQRVALQVDGLIGSREIVVKSLGVQLAGVPGIAGATILGDGRVVLILELGTLVRIGRTPHQERLVEVAGRKEREEPRLSVMVVDDSITMRKVATRLLERHNVHVLTAKDGIDALSQLQDMIPDVMLLDIEMPRMDGFELASHMRRDDRLKNVPIVMITSRTGEKHRERAAEIGVNEYLGKPYKENDLLQTILGLAHR
ncbi:MAG: Hpt domain-containing protein [Zoogloeaceae bacterium]|nr:Hpt domain-containing protein [Gammaproteobacteria bacterium]MCP5230793.1 Hpt domain-containing protein [Zoogloeaceae bacterium]